MAVISWGETGDHPVKGDIVVKPEEGGYEIVGACAACQMRVAIRLTGDIANHTPEEALARALKMHPSPPERFADNLAEVRRIYGERISRVED
jgi:hypothetical protein